MALPITMYGSRTCEDTAFTRDRLHALDIPFIERAKEDDSHVQALLEKYNHGSARTPTLVFGADQIVLVEPRIRELEDALTTAGYTFAAPQGAQFRSPISDKVAPDLKLASTRGGEFELASLRGSQRAVLFFAHDRNCRVCQGMARQLAEQARPFQESDTRLALILPESIENARAWSQEFAAGAETLADAGGEVKGKYIEYFSLALDAHPRETLLLVLDRFTAPRVGSSARDAGGLLAPHEVVQWLEFLGVQCKE